MLQMIFAKEYTHAEECDWHMYHFCCIECDAQLGGHRYMNKQGHPYCLPCYMRLFAKQCQHCQQKIAPDTKRISHQHMHWHAQDECFSFVTLHSNT